MSGALEAASPLRLTPAALFGSRRALRVLERNLLVYRRGWWYVVSGVLESVFYLFSIGVGLGHLVGAVSYAGHLVTYRLYVAPGLLAASAMNGSLIDTTYNVFHRLKITKSYDAMLATPLGTGDVAAGEIGWAVLRGAIYGTSFLAVMACLGLTGSYTALLCLPTAALVAWAFAATGMAATSYMRAWQDIDAVSLATLPMFLFSGIFYPLGVYPGWLAALVRLTPLYQGVALERAFDTGTLSPVLAASAAYLCALGLGATFVVSRRLTRLLSR